MVAVVLLIVGVLRPIRDARMGYPLRGLNQRLLNEKKGAKTYQTGAHKLEVISAITASSPSRRTDEHRLAERLQQGLFAIVISIALFVAVLLGGNVFEPEPDNETPPTTTVPE